MKIKDYLKKYLFESTWTGMGDEAGNSYPDDGSGIAGDDDRPPGNILMAPRYERGEYFNKLTPYNTIWRHDEKGGWTWDWFENATSQDDPDNYDETLLPMKDLFPEDTWKAAWSAIRKKDVPDAEVDKRFRRAGQPHRKADDVLGKHDDDQTGGEDKVADVPSELDADTKGVSEMSLIDRIDKLLIAEKSGVGDTGNGGRPGNGMVGGEVGGASGGSTWPSGKPPEESATSGVRQKKKRKRKGVVYESKVSDTILKQINAIDRFALASWGAKNYVASNDGIQFDVKGSRGRVVITYDKGPDTYIIELGNVRKLDWKSKYKIKQVFAQDLVNVLDQQIG